MHTSLCKICDKEIVDNKIRSACSNECRDILTSRLGKSSAGRKISSISRKRMSLARIGRFTQENHPLWKGEKVSYSGIHKWMVKNFGNPNQCEDCGMIGERGFNGKWNIEWANISKEYRRDKNDFRGLCKTCHGIFDTGHRRVLAGSREKQV